jgi:hypothetical protein
MPWELTRQKTQARDNKDNRDNKEGRNAAAIGYFLVLVVPGVLGVPLWVFCCAGFYRPASRATAVTSSAGSRGLARCAWKPASKARRRSSARA